MKDHLLELAERRAALQAKAALQRLQLQGHFDVIGSRTRSIDQGVSSVRRLLWSPVLVACAAALLVVTGPRRLFRMAGKAMFVLTSARRLQRSFSRNQRDISPY